MRISIVVVMVLSLLTVGTAFADPDNFGGKGKGWVETNEGPIDYYEHKNTDSHTKNFNSRQGAGKRFSQPGKAEGKASESSVIQNDPMHPGTQVLPGGNR
jgi:hypothetical protein